MRLRELRMQNGLSQRAVAAHLHISRRTYCAYESERRLPPVSVCIALARFYHTTVDYLVGLVDNPTPYQT